MLFYLLFLTTLRLVRGNFLSDPNKPLYLSGKVVDTAGEAVAGVNVQIWQTDALSQYNHPNSADLDKIDPNFQHFGTSTDADGDGTFFFKTIVPGLYPQRAVRHIHFKVFDADRREVLTSQWYFSDFDPPQANGMMIGSLGEIVDSDGKEAFTSGQITVVVDVGASGSLSLSRRDIEGPFYPGATVFDFDNDLTAIGDQGLSDEEDPTAPALDPTMGSTNRPTLPPFMLGEPGTVLEIGGVAKRLDWGMNAAPFETIQLTHCDRVVFRFASTGMSVFRMASSASFSDCDFTGAVKKTTKADGTKVGIRSRRTRTRYFASEAQCKSGVKVAVDFVKAFSEIFSCKVEGDPWKTFSDTTDAACLQRCQRMNKCNAFSFMEASTTCTLFTTSDSVTPDGLGASTCSTLLTCN